MCDNFNYFKWYQKIKKGSKARIYTAINNKTIDLR